jgi:hypothetical protein
VLEGSERKIAGLMLDAVVCGESKRQGSGAACIFLIQKKSPTPYTCLNLSQIRQVICHSASQHTACEQSVNLLHIQPL